MSTGKFDSRIFSNILKEMNDEGGFLISVLTDMEGFPIASASSINQSTDHQAAVIAMIQKTTNHVRGQLGMGMTDEFTLVDTDGQHLICRTFTAGDHSMILAILVPDRNKPYRRLTNSAIQAIRKNWQF